MKAKERLVKGHFVSILRLLGICHDNFVKTLYSKHKARSAVTDDIFIHSQFPMFLQIFEFGGFNEQYLSFFPFVLI